MDYGLRARAIDGTHHELLLRGRIYAGASQDLRKLFDDASAHARWIVVDASELEAIDAVALLGVVEAVRRLRGRGGGVGFFGLGADVRRFFELTGIDRVVAVYGSREEALRADTRGSQ
jgi:anti-anti-sigma factor